MLPMPTRLLIGLAVAVFALCAAVAFCRAQAQRPGPKASRRAAKLAPPPKWDQSVLETFSTDARQRLGPERVGDEPAASPDAAAKATAPQGGSSKTQPAPGSHWSALISAATLEDEVKAQVQPVSAAVQTPTGFKGGAYKVAREDFTLLAALFGVIGQYDGDVRWQKDAASLRDLFARAGFNCKVGTDNSFNEAKLRSQDLTELIRGGAVETRKADDEFQWPAVANRPPLMKRMERSLRERLGPWTAGKGEFSKNRDAIVHEAELLALLARIIRAEGYEYADDASYRDYVDQLERQCVEILEAAKNGELPKAQSAASQMNKTCDACHGDFRS
jgi:hypothetical protein